ncbi:glycerol-3-phosphate 1-O-acyltransferase PlsY [uncultured Tyzzerella sp.]|uniref:glycerol-3-phosphate 1-O-acyltransferase PlsY n=1 Tax=uncultured Tyzzerella sp. TaxID=2321398 RepID=UPI0029424852|nr:glycerol-3-phosphate 1-O-acyltransferase PlsY [uncultured Tyzzerella sp.]
MERILSFIIGYFIGCIQSAFIVGKLIAKIDIREHGSGNAGMTNVTRVLGAKAGIFVFVFDILKGLIAFNLCNFIFGGSLFLSGDSVLYGVYAGFGAIIGHDFPFYLKFKGGKGVATTLGFLLFVNPVIAIITYVIGFIVAFITKYISLSSLVMTLIFVIFMVISKMPFEEIFIMAIVTALCYYQHRENIKRLIKGEERKFSFKKNNG